MTVEAQLCPQCGAAVQFGEGQTEVVCSHCGTTVVKAAVAKYRPGTLLDVRYDPQARAQVSIEGRQGVKSVEQRARERQAKEQTRWKAKQAQRVEPAAAPVTPAWGGPRPEGSVPVPVE